MSDHAKLSASGAHRWLNCTPSANLETEFPDSTSKYAEEGTLAHEVAELKLQKYNSPMSMRTYNTRFNKIKKHDMYTIEIDRCTEDYIDYIKQICLSYPTVPYIAVEKRVDFGNFVPDGFGTADCIMIHGETLHVVDYKHGAGVPVSAEQNPQMMLYALGALNEYGMLYQVNTVKLAIVQPRAGGISEWEIPVTDLWEWGSLTVIPKAKDAMEGIGEFNPSDKVCRFCRAKAICRARAELHFGLIEERVDPIKYLTNDEIGARLAQAKDFANWLKDVEEYALNEVLAGREVQGWKAVEGRSNRAFKNIDIAFNKLIDSGVEYDTLYERKPITLTTVEKLVGKKVFGELLADDVEKPKGKPTLVEMSDKREPYSTIEQVFN